MPAIPFAVILANLAATLAPLAFDRLLDMWLGDPDLTPEQRQDATNAKLARNRATIDEMDRLRGPRPGE